MERELEKLEINLGGVSTMTRLPDAVFVVDPKREAIATKEVNKLGIPLIGLVDTNCDPDEVDYLIPGNDDAIRSCSLIVKTLVARGRRGPAEDPGRRVPGGGSGSRRQAAAPGRCERLGEGRDGRPRAVRVEVAAAASQAREPGATGRGPRGAGAVRAPAAVRVAGGRPVRQRRGWRRPRRDGRRRRRPAAETGRRGSAKATARPRRRRGAGRGAGGDAEADGPERRTKLRQRRGRSAEERRWRPRAGKRACPRAARRPERRRTGRAGDVAWPEDRGGGLGLM